jgi:predicted SAM-dependent methyltransferase
VHKIKKQKPILKLDLGCGKRKQEGFHGVDSEKFDGVDTVQDLRLMWPWPDQSVDEVFSSHFLEHLTGSERVHFFNELYRVMKDGSQARIITPDWSHDCAYGDPTHQWPPMSRWYPLYLNKAWREMNAPHVGYTCDFDWMTSGTWDAWLEPRPMEFKQWAMQYYNNALRDLIVILTKTVRDVKT